MNIYGTNVAIHDDICRPPHKQAKGNETSYRLKSPVNPGGLPSLRELKKSEQAALITDRKDTLYNLLLAEIASNAICAVSCCGKCENCKHSV